MKEREIVQVEPAGGSGVRYPGVGVLTLIWAFIGAAGSLRAFLSSPSAIRSDFLFWLAYIACYLPWGVFTAIVFRLERRFPLIRDKWIRHGTILLLASIPVCLVAAPMMRFSFTGALWLFERRPFPWSHFRSYSIYELLIGEFFFWLSVGGSYSIRAFAQLHQQKQRASQLTLEKHLLEASLNQAQLEVLRAKLNPHFLFNSLQNISALTRQDPVVASRMLAKLGDLLRAVLRTDSGSETTLGDEIELLRHYIALEQMRFGDRLEFTVEVGPGTEPGLVPIFLLQPLVENAVIHGMRGVRQEGVIRIESNLYGNNLQLKVTDNGKGFEEGKNKNRTGLGLSSTRERLSRMYPNNHVFTIQPATSRGTEVVIVIPFRDGGAGDAGSPEENQRAIANR